MNDWPRERKMNEKHTPVSVPVPETTTAATPTAATPTAAGKTAVDELLDRLTARADAAAASARADAAAARLEAATANAARLEAEKVAEAAKKAQAEAEARAVTHLNEADDRAAEALRLGRIQGAAAGIVGTLALKAAASKWNFSVPLLHNAGPLSLPV